MQLNPYPITGALNNNTSDSGMLQFFLQILTYLLILIQVGGIIFISVPDRIPCSGNIEPQTYGIDFLSQGIPPFPYTVNLKDSRVT